MINEITELRTKKCMDIDFVKLLEVRNWHDSLILKGIRGISRLWEVATKKASNPPLLVNRCILTN